VRALPLLSWPGETKECSMAHISRLTGQVRALLQARRVAALGTIGPDGAALVSMVPFATEPQQRCLVIHVSELAAHTRNLQATPRISLLVMEAEVAGEPVHALPRVTFDGSASVPLRDSALWLACRAAYLGRFPEAQMMTQLGDFKFVAIEVKGARQVAGFGSARSIDEDEVRLALGPA
jgi:putative heme iron utilization protein